LAGSCAVVGGVAGASDFVWTGDAAEAAEDCPEFSADDWALAAAETRRISIQISSRDSRDAARPRRNGRNALMGIGSETRA